MNSAGAAVSGEVAGTILNIIVSKVVTGETVGHRTL